jgi:putative FmdB family regulatory protein
MEAIQKMSDSPLKDCPACGKPQLTKLISAAGFRLKGSGWYETDFKNSGKKKPADKPAAAKGDGKKSDSGTKAAACGTGACPACTD